LRAISRGAAAVAGDESGLLARDIGIAHEPPREADTTPHMVAITEAVKKADPDCAAFVGVFVERTT
jgi:hypothetical protein